jgi:hypothetical protein
MPPVAAPWNPDRTFFASFAALALTLTIIGFAPTFFLKGEGDGDDCRTV